MQPPIRIGLLLDSYIQPRWVSRIIADIQTSSIAQVCLVILNGNQAEIEYQGSEKGMLHKLLAFRHDLLYLLYRKVDERLFKPKMNAFDLVDTRQMLAGCPSILVKPVQKKYSDYLEPADAASISAAGLDVALRFGFRILQGDFLKIARCGVWSFHHGDNAVNRGGPPGFWEVMEENPQTGSVLQILSDQLDNGQVIYRSYAATDPYSVVRNKNAFYWKSSAFVMRKLNDLYERGPQSLACERESRVYQPYSQRLYKQPQNLEMLPLLWKWARRYAGAKLIFATHHFQWYLQFQAGKHTHLAPSFYRFKNIVPPNDRFWADPFPRKQADRYFIFIEEFLHRTKKGHIAVIEMDPQGNWQAPVKVLERDYHLSYPFVFEWLGEIWMIPESSDNKTIEIYHCASFPHQWQMEQVLLQGVRAVDTTLAEIDGVWWMFTNLAEEGASKDDELHIFYADTPMGPWQPHRANPVKSDVRSARPAGKLFQWKGSWYRPAQDCTQTYGRAIVMNEIIRLDKDCFEEREISRILPNWEKGLLATHTLNRVDGLTVVDAMRPRRKW